MGIYLYTLRKKAVEATVEDVSRTVKVGLIKFFTKEYNGIYETAFFKRENARVKKMIAEGFNPDCYAPTFNGIIYKFQGFGIFGDTPDFGKPCGRIFQKGKSYVVILMKEGESYDEFYERTRSLLIQ